MIGGQLLSPADRRHICRGPLLYARLPELCPHSLRRSQAANNGLVSPKAVTAYHDRDAPDPSVLYSPADGRPNFRSRSEADILRQAHEGPEQSVISSAARWISRRQGHDRRPARLATTAIARPASHPAPGLAPHSGHPDACHRGNGTGRDGRRGRPPAAAAAQASPAQGRQGPGDRGKELPVVVPPVPRGSAKSRTTPCGPV